MIRMLRGLFAAVLGAAALCSSPAAAQSQADAIARAEARGRLLFAYDQAAWVSTDDLQLHLSDPRSVGLNGWVIEPLEDSLLVTFVTRGDAGFSAYYRAEVRGRTVVSSHVLGAEEDKTLTPAQLAMLRARDAASVDLPTPCTNAMFNTVILPPDPGTGLIDVYLLSAWVETPIRPMGGHYLFRVDADGHVASRRSFTRSCLNFELDPNMSTEALMVTHLLDPTPTEVHVFLSLTFGMPIYVSIGNPPHNWAVDGGHIREVD